MKKLTIYRQYLTKSKCYTSGTKQTPKGVQVHSTGANNPNLKRYVQPNDGRLGNNANNNSHNNPNANVCASAYIGKLENGTPAVYQTLPWNYRCWLSGSGRNGNANRLGYIGFEICEDNKQNSEYFNAAVMELAVNLTAFWCQEYNIPVSMVKDHHELYNAGLASNHADITHWLKIYGLTMNDFRREVQKVLNEGIQVTYITGNKTEIVNPPNTNTTIKVSRTALQDIKDKIIEVLTIMNNAVAKIAPKKFNV